ncbi:hypothetical protein [Staphylococcus saprophyticus]|uniref:hypothetical protein n=1 Tax=Staphylococcus saprophyticus TaxID=29385 RepID=UPI0011AA2DBD|nr:hypothetical protein [Staphylococcus saprophyticus]
MGIVGKVERLDVEGLKKMLTEGKNGLVKEYTKMVEVDDVRLEFRDEGLSGISNKGIEGKRGGGGLR